MFSPLRFYAFELLCYYKVQYNTRINHSSSFNRCLILFRVTGGAGPYPSTHQVRGHTHCSPHSDPIHSAIRNQSLRLHNQEELTRQLQEHLIRITECQESRLVTVSKRLSALLAHFKLQAPAFQTERSKVAYVILHLTGKAEAWATAEWARRSRVCVIFSILICFHSGFSDHFSWS